MSEVQAPHPAKVGTRYYFPPRTPVEREALDKALDRLPSEGPSPTLLEVPLLLVDGQRARVALSAEAVLIPDKQRKYDFELIVTEAGCTLKNLRNHCSATVVDWLTKGGVSVISRLSEDPVQVEHFPGGAIRAIQCSGKSFVGWVFSGSLTGGRSRNYIAEAQHFNAHYVGHEHFDLKHINAGEGRPEQGFVLSGVSGVSGNMYIEVSQSTD